MGIRKAHITEDLDQLLRQHIEEVDVLQGADHCQHAEQAGQGLHVEICEVGLVRRDQKAGDQRRQHGDHHHHVLFDEGIELSGVEQVVRGQHFLFLIVA